MSPGRPFSELRDSGLLWLINASLLHPRGFALGLHFDDAGEAIGWSIMGDGTERWVFAESGWPEGVATTDDAFLAVKELLQPVREAD